MIYFLEIARLYHPNLLRSFLPTKYVGQAQNIYIYVCVCWRSNCHDMIEILRLASCLGILLSTMLLACVLFVCALTQLF